MAANDGSGVTTKRTGLTQSEQDQINRDFDKTHGGPMADGSAVRKANQTQTDKYNKNMDDALKDQGA